MKSNLTILSTIPTKRDDDRHLLTKIFSRDDAGDDQVRAYDKAYLFDADFFEIGSIDDLHDALTWLETQPYACVIRGEPIDQTRNIRRALNADPKKGPATIRQNPNGVHWIMLDFDGIPASPTDLPTEQSRVEYLVAQLPPEFQNVTYHYQWSSSAGVGGWDTLSCHIWFWLSSPWFCRDLHDRFYSGDYAYCEVDAAPFVANQVHYTANPIFKGVQDPVERRSGLVRGAVDAVTLAPWIKPVAPAYEMSNREHYNRFGLSRFDDLLADIGPGYHRPILIAIAHYIAVVDPLEYDEAYLCDRVREAIDAGVPSRNAKSKKSYYRDQGYLNRVIEGAKKYGRAF